LDPSGGQGKRADFTYLDDLITRLHIDEIKDRVQVGIAGGFTPENIHQYTTKYPSFSIDVESGVRTNDQFDIEKAKRYVENSLMNKEQLQNLYSHALTLLNNLRNEALKNNIDFPYRNFLMGFMEISMWSIILQIRPKSI
jgi:hypothetical protein